MYVDYFAQHCSFMDNFLIIGYLFFSVLHVSLSFFDGAKIGIVGVNGCGKSSFMKIIAGLDEVLLTHHPLNLLRF